MYVSNKDLRFALDEAQFLTEQYEVYSRQPKGVRRSLDETLWIFGEYLKKKVEVNEVTSIKMGDSSFLGQSLLGDLKCIINLVSELNFCYKRFVLCKELFHVLLDKPEYRNMDLFAHIEEVIILFPVVDSRPKPSSVSEFLAEVAAMQFLFPYEDRRKILARGIAPNFQEIAETYKIPRVYVEKYLSENYMEILSAFYPSQKVVPAA